MTANDIEDYSRGIDRGTNGPIDDADSEADNRRHDDDREISADELELTAQVELLTEETRRLRTEYARSLRSKYRHTAYGLVALGLIAALGGLLLPNGREVLFAFAGTGLFGGLLTYYLTPGQFVAASISERVYAAMAANDEALVEELGLRADRVYVPSGQSELARLFIPQRKAYELPETFSKTVLTDADERGLLLEPTGDGLFREFERTLEGALDSSPHSLAMQLTDGLVETLALARSADSDVDAKNGRATIAITESAFGPVDRFDHPIASFVAVGFAIGLDRPVTLEVTSGTSRADWLITCRWESDEDTST